MKINVHSAVPDNTTVARALYKLRVTNIVCAVLATTVASFFVLSYGANKPLLVVLVCAAICGGFTYFFHGVDAQRFAPLSDMDSYDVTQWMPSSSIITAYVNSVREQHRELLYCEYKALKAQYTKELGEKSRTVLYGPA